MSLHPQTAAALAAQAVQLVALIHAERLINPFPLSPELLDQSDAVSRIARQLLAAQDHDQLGRARFVFDPPEGGEQ